MNKEFYKMQKTAGLITESEYKEKVNEAKGDLTTLLYSLINSINSNNKELSMDIIEKLLSIARDIEDTQLNEIKDEEKFIKDFKKYIGDTDATSAVIDYFSKENKLTPEQKLALKNKFLTRSDFSIKSTGPLSPDIKPRFDK